VSLSAAPIALPPSGSCFIDASRPQVHKDIPSEKRAPLLGFNDWRVDPAFEEKMMERRGWLQTLCTTVTTPEQIRQVPRGVERIFIPGEFCRQGDVLSAAASSGKIIILERGAFLAPNDLKRALDKLSSAEGRIILAESGSAFGYSDRVLDPRSLEVMSELGCPLAINLNALCAPVGTPYEHRPQWLDDSTFDMAYIRMALAFGVQYLLLPIQRELQPTSLALWLSAHKE
jgi:3-deoxy-D-manno-octulosonic acid (KDO) 8-phosphate synthase